MDPGCHLAAYFDDRVEFGQPCCWPLNADIEGSSGVKPGAHDRRLVSWQGPFGWPGFEAISRLEPLPEECGVYLQTYCHGEGYLIYGAGLTRRPFNQRFREHTRKYLSGDYTVLDVPAIETGQRVEIWHGWGWTPEKRQEFAERAEEIRSSANDQMSQCRVFIAALGKEPRFLERVEAAVMEALYRQPEPISAIPDRGMQLSPRWPNEDPIVIENIMTSILHGLPYEMEV